MPCGHQLPFAAPLASNLRAPAPTTARPFSPPSLRRRLQLLHEIATQATPVRGRMRPVQVPQEAPAELVGLINLCMRSGGPLSAPAGRGALAADASGWVPPSGGCALTLAVGQPPLAQPPAASCLLVPIINRSACADPKERPTAAQVVSQLKLIRRRMLRDPDTARLLRGPSSGNGSGGGSMAGTLGSAPSGGSKPDSGRQASGGAGTDAGSLGQGDSLPLSKEGSAGSASLPLRKGSSLPLIKGGVSS